MYSRFLVRVVELKNVERRFGKNLHTQYLPIITDIYIYAQVANCCSCVTAQMNFSWLIKQKLEFLH